MHYYLTKRTDWIRPNATSEYTSFRLIWTLKGNLIPYQWKWRARYRQNRQRRLILLNNEKNLPAIWSKAKKQWQWTLVCLCPSVLVWRHTYWVCAPTITWGRTCCYAGLPARLTSKAGSWWRQSDTAGRQANTCRNKNRRRNASQLVTNHFNILLWKHVIFQLSLRSWGLHMLIIVKLWLQLQKNHHTANLSYFITLYYLGSFTKQYMYVFTKFEKVT